MRGAAEIIGEYGHYYEIVGEDWDIEALPLPATVKILAVADAFETQQMATPVPASPARSGAAGLRTASTKRSRRRTKSRVATNPPPSAAAAISKPNISISFVARLTQLAVREFPPQISRRCNCFPESGI